MFSSTLFTIYLALVASILSCYSTTEVGNSEDLEGPCPLESNLPVGIIEVAYASSELLGSPEFSSLLQAYSEHVAYERRLSECRRWVDVEQFKAKKAEFASWWLEDLSEAFPADVIAQYGGDCSSLNTQYGAVIKDVPVPSSDSAPIFVQCTAGPWFADVQIEDVERKDNSAGAPYYMAHVSYTPPLPDSASQVPKYVPLDPLREVVWLRDFHIPQRGDKATLLCLEEGTPLMYLRRESVEPHIGE